jgi:hypothetical protein
VTLEEAVAAFESRMSVHDAVGYPVNDHGAKDMSRAPTGERYVTLTSAGTKSEGHPVQIWWAHEDQAVEYWLDTVTLFARWLGKQLYWRERPELVTQTFMAVNQAEAMQDQRLRDSLSVELHTVWCRLLVSAKGPDGKVIDVIEGADV